MIKKEFPGSLHVMIYFFILIGIFLNISYGTSAKSPLIVIVPQNRISLINAPGANIVGSFDKNEVSTIQLLEPFQAKKNIDVSTKGEKENFPKIIRQMFTENLFIEHLVLNVDKLKGKSETLHYQFSLTENFDLKKFWASTLFREILAVVYDAKIIAAEVTISGKLKREIVTSLKEYQQKFGSVFSFSVSLQPGTNSFYLRSLSADGSVVVVDTVAFFYQTQVQRDNPLPQFQHQPFHTDSLESQCTVCHALTLQASVKENKPTVETECKTCHNNLVIQKTSHVPANSWDCLMCHDPASSPKYQLYQDKKYDASLCFECHGDKQEDLTSKPTKHAPAESGECLTCHDPHGTQNEALLVDKVKNICKACHEDMVSTPHPVANHPLGERADPSRSGKELTCASCHNPHASDNQSLLIAPRMQLCGKCHQK